MNAHDLHVKALAAKPRKVEIPELGTIYVKKMAGEHRALIEEELRKPQHRTALAKIVAYSVCDDQGNLVFADKDIAEINKWPFDLIDKIIMEANGESELSAERIDELKKILNETPSGVSS